VSSPVLFYVGSAIPNMVSNLTTHKYGHTRALACVYTEEHPFQYGS